MVIGFWYMAWVIMATVGGLEWSGSWIFFFTGTPK